MFKIAKKIDLEPISGELFSKVPVRKITFKKNFPTEPEKWHVGSSRPKNLSVWLPLNTVKEFCQGGFVFPIVSSIKNYTGVQLDTNIWKPFSVNGCKIEVDSSVSAASEKFIRIIQKFKITGKNSGSFQMICQNWQVKHRDQYYNRNDIITVYYGENKPNPWPVYQNVIPDEIQTFVPVTLGSRVNILVDKSKQTIGELNPDSKIKLFGEIFFDHSFPLIGTPLVVYRYGITEKITGNDYLFLNHKKWHNEVENRIIVFVPYRETAGFRYILVENPHFKSTVLTQGCHAVKIVTRNFLGIKMNDNCPANISFVARIAGRTVYMIVLRSPCPSIIIDKSVNGWEVRCPY